MACDFADDSWRLCGPLILVDQAAENLVTSYLSRRHLCDRRREAVAFVVRWPQAPGPVRAMPVVVRDVLIL